MIRIGIIGYGSMGRMLLHGFIKSGVVAPKEIIVSTRTKSKLIDIKNSCTGVNTAQDNIDVAKNAKYIFVCVEPHDVQDVLHDIKSSLNTESVIISIAGTVSMNNIGDWTHAKAVRLIPSLTSEVLEGISLVCFNEKVSPEEAAYMESLLNGISKVKRIQEDDFALATDLTSCAPGFFAAIADEFAQSALRRNSALSRADIEDMVIRTFYGTAKVLVEKNMGFGDMIQRVATKGGITEEGVKVLKSQLPNTFDQVFEATSQKRKKLSKIIE